MTYTIDELAELQVKLEIGMKAAGTERFHKNNQRAIDNQSSSETQWNKRILQNIIHPMSRAIEAYIDYYSGRRGKPVKALAYIKLIDPCTASFIALKTIIDWSVGDTNLDTVIDKIGQRLEDQVRFESMEKFADKYTAKVKDRLNHARSKSYTHQRNAMLAGERKLSEGSDIYEAMDEWEPWGIDIHRHIGSMLVNIVLEQVTFEGEPVFKKINIFQSRGNSKGKKYKEVTKLVPTDHVCNWIDEYKEVMETESPAYRPCIVPPLDWTTPTNGGYHVPEIRNTLPLIKGRKSQIKRLTIEQMPAVYKAINGLQSIPWQISKQVLQVAMDIKELGIDLAMPQREPYPIPECPVPPEYKEFKGQDLKRLLTDKEWQDFITWRREATSVYLLDNKRKSKYMTVHSTISTAKMYQEFERFYFVYTMDSRGRVYAKSDTISPQGDDLQKGLIKFAEGKPLGAEGMYWLAVHGAGKWGNDKVPFDDRVQFIEDMTEDIRDFVADPLTNTGWAGADKPWQFLNWCFEWASLADWIDEGKNASDFISYIPCAQDGSCSGLQHYSAMLRDIIGGRAVNLVPDDKPNDIYKKVSDLATLKLEDIAKTGVAEFTFKEPMQPETLKEIASGLLAVKGGINRSITKPPVMTKTYGSTYMRCMETTSQYFIDLQAKENKEAKAERREPIPVHPFAQIGEEGVTLKDAEKVCAKVIWDSLNETVTSAVDGMQFIQKVAAYMAKAGCHLEWETPTGFIVEQKEFEYKSRRIKTQLLGNTRFSIAEETTKLDVHKMQSSSSPNFVHSMDASHLVLAVNAFIDAGFTGIAIIHDDFGTHACDTPKLRDLLRETFVNMYYKNDVLDQFLEHNEALLLEEIDVPLPASGTLNIKDVLTSNYAFG
jgi:DNA-directed RNA polymerase